MAERGTGSGSADQYTVGGGGSSFGWWNGNGGNGPRPATISRSTVVDCGPGWVRVLINNDLPYVCNSTMTQHEQDVFAQIDQEDQLDNNNANLDCQGTGRSGNIKFPGTKEHWLIQLDYISQNPVFGRREFAVPNGSITNPANRDYADVVNLQNGNMFEIKPNTFNNIQNAEAEISNYVSKANLNCTGTLPIPVIWNKGNLYSDKYFPTNTQGTYLKAFFATPGVIAYEYVSTTNPVPAPVPVPSSVVEKLKNLIDRLRQNFGDADKIISEFFDQNPGLEVAIRSAIITTGIGIIVGTIIEDVITAGSGIADDWACFLMAYKIIRFAIKL